MKKILFALITMLCLIGIVSAKEYCAIVSGDGTHIGDEIACGTEHFYVIESKDDNIKMLSKYNLYVGNNYNKIKLDINTTYIQAKCTNGWCSASNGAKFFFEGNQVSNYSE